MARADYEVRENRFGGLQLAHLVSNGKSFFFNKQAGSTSDYLKINAMSRLGKESITLFPNQMQDFVEALSHALDFFGAEE